LLFVRSLIELGILAVFEMIFRLLFEIVTHSFVAFLLALYSVCTGLLVIFETSY